MNVCYLSCALALTCILLALDSHPLCKFRVDLAPVISLPFFVSD